MSSVMDRLRAAQKKKQAKQEKIKPEKKQTVSRKAADEEKPVRRSSNVVNASNILDKLRKAEKQVKDPATRYPCGIPVIDELFTGMGKSGLKAGIYLLVADPGAGKSSFALQISSALRSRGHNGAYLAYEGKENVHEIVNRLGLPRNIAVVDQSDDWQPDSKDLAEKIKMMREACEDDKPTFVVVDSVKNLNAEAGQTVGRREAIKDLMQVSHDENCIVFLIAHVAAECRGKKIKKIQGPSELGELCDVRIDMTDVTEKDAKSQGFRHIMIDTFSKNRYGKPGQFFGFMLREDGFHWPSRLFGTPEEAVGGILEATDE